MGKRIIFFLYYYFFWVLYFGAAQLVFLFYHREASEGEGFLNWLKAMYYGLSMHCSAAAALLIFPALVLLFTTQIRGGRISSVIINAYTCIVLLLLTCLVVFDLALYQQNGVRLDGVSLQFLKENDGVDWWQSLNGVTWIRLLLIYLVICVVFIAYYFESVGPVIAYFKKAHLLSIIIIAVLSLSLYVPLTKGIGVITLSAESAPFANNFLNDAVQNPIWQVGYYLIQQYI